MVSTVLLVVAFLLVVSFRWVVVPRGPSATHQELVLDFTMPNPSATAVFMPPRSVASIEALEGPEMITTSVMRSHRVIAAGQSFDVHVELRLPENAHNREKAGVFQVTCELLTAKGDVIGKATRPASLAFRSFKVRLLKFLVMWPLHAFDLVKEEQVVRLPMFSGATESKDAPFVSLRATLSPRFSRALPNGNDFDGIPHVSGASADVRLDMGILRRFLYYYPASSFVLMLGATWGYLCAAALLSFAAVAGLGLVKSPTAFAEEVARRATEVMKGTGGAGGTGGLDASFPRPFFEPVTSSDDEGVGAHSNRRKSGESDEGSEASGASDLGGASTAGLRYRGAPRPGQ